MAASRKEYDEIGFKEASSWGEAVKTHLADKHSSPFSKPGYEPVVRVTTNNWPDTLPAGAPGNAVNNFRNNTILPDTTGKEDKEAARLQHKRDAMQPLARPRRYDIVTGVLRPPDRGPPPTSPAGIRSATLPRSARDNPKDFGVVAPKKSFSTKRGTLNLFAEPAPASLDRKLSQRSEIEAREYNILSNRYKSDHETREAAERAAADERVRVRLEAQPRFDPVKARDNNPAFEDKFVARVAEERQVGLERAVARQPVCVANSPAKKYNVISGEVYDPEGVKRLEERERVRLAHKAELRTQRVEKWEAAKSAPQRDGIRVHPITRVGGTLTNWSKLMRGEDDWEQGDRKALWKS